MKTGGRLYYTCIREGYELYQLSTGDLINNTQCNGTHFNPPISDMICKGLSSLYLTIIHTVYT